MSVPLTGAGPLSSLRKPTSTVPVESPAVTPAAAPVSEPVTQTETPSLPPRSRAIASSRRQQAQQEVRGLQQRLHDQVADRSGEPCIPPHSSSARRYALAPPPSASTAAVNPDSLRIAQRMVRAGGTGTQEDVDAVTQQLAALPSNVLSRLEARGVQLVACRESVTDYRTDLRGVQPRGWPPGATWDQVPGLHDPSSNEVVIATEDNGSGGRVTSSKHGSSNLVLHEVGHAADFTGALGEESESPIYQSAYGGDHSRLTAINSYLTQPGAAGRQESFAETFAYHYGGDPILSGLPYLQQYWKDLDASLTP